MLSCKKVIQQSDAYLAGELSFWQKLSFRFHLAMCKHCRHYTHRLWVLTSSLGKRTAHQCDHITEDEINDIFQKIQASKNIPK